VEDTDELEGKSRYLCPHVVRYFVSSLGFGYKSYCNNLNLSTACCALVRVIVLGRISNADITCKFDLADGIGRERLISDSGTAVTSGLMGE